jgi:uncharacterized protein
MIVGVISDTHGLLRREVLDVLRGVDRILHAGDIGAPGIVEDLARIAPVTAIRGNIDVEPWASHLPETELIELDEFSIYMLHDLGKLDLKPEAAGIRVVIYGHSHHPKIDQRNGVLYFNPGSAGPRRFSLPVSLGKLVLVGKKTQAELIELRI